ncbi:MAG TPA: hypothetical protein EYG28_05160 [Nitrospiria bacterium]|nr:hypothetical protein [Candidatus Manganitrophaceae bacterium]HIL34773.1 hypothetical protein [Candidatus Manganitrophaceae bacterium]
MKHNEPIEKSSTKKTPDPHDFRCFCGSLIARFCQQGLELKCKRCKRLHVVPVSEIVFDVFPQQFTKS